jgi:hypothetical protein
MKALGDWTIEYGDALLAAQEDSAEPSPGRG